MILDLSNEIDTLRGADSEYELEVKLLKEQIVAFEKENILFQKKEKDIEKVKQKEMEKVKQNKTKLTTALTTLKEQKDNNQHQIQELITSHNAAAILLKEQVTAVELQKKELLLKLTKEQDKYILLTTKYEEEKKMQNKFSKESTKNNLKENQHQAIQINQLNELNATLKTSLHVSQVSETKATATIQEMNGTVTQLNQVNATLILSNTKANTTIKDMAKLMKLKIENEKEKNKSIQLLESKLLVQKTDIIQATQQMETETNHQLSTTSNLNTEILTLTKALEASESMSFEKQKQHEVLMTEMNELKKKEEKNISQLTNELTSLTSSFQTYKETEEQNQATTKTMHEESLRVLQQECDLSTRTAVDEVEQMKLNYTSKIAELQLEITESEATLKKTKQKTQEMTIIENNNIKTIKTTNQTTIDTLNKQIHTLTSSLNQFQQNETLSKVNEEKVTQEQNIIVNKFQQKIKTCEHENNTLKSKMEQMSILLKESKDNAELSTSELYKKVTELNTSLQQESEQTMKLKTEIEQHTLIVEKMKADIIEKEILFQKQKEMQRSVHDKEKEQEKKMEDKRVLKMTTSFTLDLENITKEEQLKCVALEKKLDQQENTINQMNIEMQEKEKKITNLEKKMEKNLNKNKKEKKEKKEKEIVVSEKQQVLNNQKDEEIVALKQNLIDVTKEHQLLVKEKKHIQIKMEHTNQNNKTMIHQHSSNREEDKIIFEKRLDDLQNKWKKEYLSREEKVLLNHSNEMQRLKNTIIEEYENERKRNEEVLKDKDLAIATLTESYEQEKQERSNDITAIENKLKIEIKKNLSSLQERKNLEKKNKIKMINQKKKNQADEAQHLKTNTMQSELLTALNENKSLKIDLITIKEEKNQILQNRKKMLKNIQKEQKENDENAMVAHDKSVKQAVQEAVKDATETMQLSHALKWEKKLLEVTTAAQGWENSTAQLEKAREEELLNLKVKLTKEHDTRMEEALQRHSVVSNNNKSSLHASQISKISGINELKMNFSTKIKQLKQMNANNILAVQNKSELLFNQKIKAIKNEYKNKLEFEMKKYKTKQRNTPFSSHYSTKEQKTTELLQLKKTADSLKRQLKNALKREQTTKARLDSLTPRRRLQEQNIINNIDESSTDNGKEEKRKNVVIELRNELKEKTEQILHLENVLRTVVESVQVDSPKQYRKSIQNYSNQQQKKYTKKI